MNSKLKLGDMLVQKKLITEEQLTSTLETKERRMKLGEALIKAGHITERDLALALSEQLGIDFVELSQMEIDKELVSTFNVSILKKNIMIPLSYTDDNRLLVAMADPLDIDALDDMKIMANMPLENVIATTRDIMLAIAKNCSKNDTQDAVSQYSKEKIAEIATEDMTVATDIDSPIVTMVKEMIETAVRMNASDIHIEPLDDVLRVRYRIDGELYENSLFAIEALSAVVTRIKIIGGMDISEKRKPQDGRITQIVDNIEYDIRVSVLPTVYGEKVVMRLTRKSALSRDKKQLGLKDKELEKFNRILAHPHGILLVTGPTGSGKSTTLYTALSELNKEGVNIITVEDPVEANIRGINQVQTNEKAGLTFSSALRSILRQDPDIIMIGEIRDKETASIAVQASITGHLVVSTLHTNSAASTVTRLEDMGVESYLIADAVVGIIAQRLVRVLCPHCKKEVMANAEQKKMLRVSEAEDLKLYEPCGCSKCNNTGYRGRIGVYEILEVTPEVQNVISKEGSAEDIKRTAVSQGMRTLHECAMEYVLDGTTSYGEMIKVSFDS